MISEITDIKKFTGFLVCRIGNKEFCFDMHDLVKIVDPPEKEKLNGNNTMLDFGGVLFRNIFISRVYNLETTINNSSKMILLEIAGKAICFLVDKVVEMIATSEKTLEALVFITSNDPSLKGTIEYEGREILVPSMQNVIDLS